MKRRNMVTAAALLGVVALVLIGIYAGNHLTPDLVCHWATRGHGC